MWATSACMGSLRTISAAPCCSAFGDSHYIDRYIDT
jgi:hypothetical protein